MSEQFDQALCDLDAATLQRLNDLVARAHARTSASGVAIALVEDNDLVTCAAFGGSAPEVGTRTPIDASFSGRCALSGEMLICADVMNDERLDGDACASVGIFSMVMVPISESGKTRGVLAAFSDRPNSFSPNQLTVLNTFAEIANELLHHRDQATSGEVPTPVASVTDPSAKCETTVLHDVLSAYEAERRQHSEMKPAMPVAPEVIVTPAASVASSAQVTPPQKFEPAATVVPLPTMTATVPAPQVKPAPTPGVSEPKPEKLGPQIVRTPATRGAAATQMARAPEHVAKTEPVIALKPAVEKPKPVDSSKPLDDSGLLSFAADPMPVKKGQVIGNPKAERSSPMRDNDFLASYHAPAKSNSSALKFVLGGAAVLVLAGAVFGFSHIGHRTASVSAATPAQEATAPVQTSAPVATLPTTSTPVSNTPVTSSPVATPVVKDVASKAAVSEVKSSEVTRHTEDAKPAHEQKAVPQPELAIKTPDGSVKRRPVEIADVQAPTLVAGLSPNAMPELHATVVPPKADFPTATVSAPKLLNGPRPVFPQAANVLHLTGDTVVLNAKVLPNGKIGDINVVRGNRVFVDAVKDAVKRWQYAPAQLNNQPTEATVEIVFKFGQGK